MRASTRSTRSTLHSGGLRTSTRYAKPSSRARSTSSPQITRRILVKIRTASGRRRRWAWWGWRRPSGLPSRCSSRSGLLSWRGPGRPHVDYPSAYRTGAGSRNADCTRIRGKHHRLGSVGAGHARDRLAGGQKAATAPYLGRRMPGAVRHVLFRGRPTVVDGALA